MDEEQETQEEQVNSEETPSLAYRLGSGLGNAVGGIAGAVPRVVSGILPSPSEVNAETGEDELADLFETPQEGDNDINCDDLLELDEEDVMGGPEDMSDLLQVSREDIVNGNDKPKKPKPKLIWTGKPYPPQLTGLR